MNDDQPMPQLPASITDVTLVVPNGVTQTIELDKIPFVKTLVVRNTVGFVPPGVVKLRIRNATNLVDLQLDNCQRIDLAVDQAPRLLSISDTLWSDATLTQRKLTKDDCLSRLQRLDLKGVPNLQELRADIGECESIEIHDEGLQLGSCVVSSVSYDHVPDDHRMDATELPSLGTSLAKLNATTIKLIGMEIDQSVVSSLFDTETRSIVILQCNVADDAFDAYTAEADLHSLDAMD